MLTAPLQYYWFKRYVKGQNAGRRPNGLHFRIETQLQNTFDFIVVSTLSKRRYDNLAMIKTLLLGMLRMFTQKIFFSSISPFHEAEKLVLSSGSCKMSPEQPFSFHPQLSFQVFFS